VVVVVVVVVWGKSLYAMDDLIVSPKEVR